MYNTIKTALTAAGIQVYDPAVKIGECKGAYAVAHDMGTQAQDGTKGLHGWRTYEIVLLVPLSTPDALADLVARARAALAGIRGLRYTGDQAPTGIEATYRALSASLIFKNPTII